MRDININILYWLISRVVNGDKIVTNMLDEQIMIIDDEEEESDDNCSDSGDEVFYSDLEDDDCSDSEDEIETDGNF